jgi:hypothetical protein
MYLEKIDVEVRQIQREHDSSIPKNKFRIPNHFKQFIIFFRRDVLAKLHNEQYLFINALEAPLLAVILAFFTKNYVFINGVPKYIFGENPNIPAFLFMSVIVSLFMGLVISAEEIFRDRKLLKREKFLNLSRSSYLFSKIIILFTISAIQTIIFVAIANSMLEIRNMAGYYWLILFTASCWANLVGLIISSGLNSVVTIYVLVPLILVPQLLLSGVVVEYDKMHNKIASQKNVPLIGDFITCRWAYEALMVSQFKYNKFERNFYPIEEEIQNTIFYKSYGIPELRKLCNESSRLVKENRDTIKLSQNISVIKNGIIEIFSVLNWQKPGFIDSTQLSEIDKSLISSANNFFDKAEKQFIVNYNTAVSERDEKYDQMVKKLGGEEEFFKFKQRYFNKQLANVVTNSNEIKVLNIQDGEMFRLKDAIFRKPLQNNGRAHFYAPVKRISNLTIGTFWFNLMFLWLYTGFLFVLLYFDVLRKIIVYFETVLINRRNRMRLLRLLKVYDQDDKWKPRPRKK